MIPLPFQAFISTGFNLVLSFDTFSHSFHPDRRQIDFEKEPGKVRLMIMGFSGKQERLGFSPFPIFLTDLGAIVLVWTRENIE